MSDSVSIQRLNSNALDNGDTLQDWNASDMIFNVPNILQSHSGSATSLPIPVILTATLQGMTRTPLRWLQAGDEVALVIEGISRLSNPICSEEVDFQAE